MLFFDPRYKKDVSSKVRHIDKLHISYLDQNTLVVTVPNKRLLRSYTLKTGTRNVTLVIDQSEAFNP